MSPTSFLYFSDAVLSAIFLSFCGGEPVCLPLRTNDRRRTLRLVHRRWDVIVRSTNALWNKILFTSPTFYSISTDVLLNQFTTCTMRSGNSLLTIIFDMGRHNWPFSIVDYVILPNARRIQKLTCPIHTNDDIATFLTIPEGQLSALQSIEVAFINTWDVPRSHFGLDDCLYFNALRTAPRLQEVIMHMFNGLHPFHLHIPWDQLTCLDLGSTAIRPENFLRIIRYSALQLKEGFFQIKFSSPCPKLVISQNAVVMHSLRSLRLRLVYPSNDHRLFSVLRFPALQSLRVEMIDIFQDWDLSVYINLLRASSRTLRDLYLSDFFSPGLRVFRTAEDTESHPVRRRYRETTHQALENLFHIVPNITNLHLPLGLFIHVPTVEKLALCNLLPQLCVMMVGASSIDSAQHILLMLQNRHKHVLNFSRALGNSTVVPHVPNNTARPPTVISLIALFIPQHQYTQEAAMELCQQSWLLASLGIVVDFYPTYNLPLRIR